MVELPTEYPLLPSFCFRRGDRILFFLGENEDDDVRGELPLPIALPLAFIFPPLAGPDLDPNPNPDPLSFVKISSTGGESLKAT